jgi:hypothetical protein
MSSCDKCGRSGIKLWRPHGGYPQPGQLLCIRHLSETELYQQRKGPGIPSNISVSYIPAVVITGSDTKNFSYYSFCDVPMNCAEIWKSLPE